MSRRKKQTEARQRRQKTAGQSKWDKIFRMAEHASPPKALEIYQAILDACQILLGAAMGGRLWDQPDGRRHLQALFGVAVSLRTLGLHAQAAERFQELLQRDPEDHPFARYWLAACWLDLEQHAELAKLLERPDDAAVWRYAQALLAFRIAGDDEPSQRLLRDAQSRDPRFLDYLLNDALLDASQPVRWDGSPEERALSCARLFLPAWRSTPGAAAWARRTLKVPLSSPASEPPPRRVDLRDLPQRPVTWQLGLQPFDASGPSNWLLVVGSIDDRKMLLMTILEDEPTPSLVWREVSAAARRPMDGAPHRPLRLEVPRADYQTVWQPLLAENAVECVFVEDPQPIGELTAALLKDAKDRKSPPLADDVDPRGFPQTDDVWQAGFHHTTTWISSDQDGTYRPWAALVLNKSPRNALLTELVPGDPAPEQLWESLVRAMVHPGRRDSLRPALIEVADSDCYDFLKPKLAECGIRCVLADALPEWDDFCAALADYDTSEKCALADGEGVELEQMESFYQEAARYFQAAPWRHVPGEVPIHIDCPGLKTGDRWAVVLGRTGVQLGLALYDDWDSVMNTLHGLSSPDDFAALTVLFDEEMIMAGADLHLLENHGWPIAAPEAFPAALRIDGGRTRSPSAEELRLLEGCLRVLPDFVTSARRSQRYQVEAGGKRFQMRLSVK